MTLHRRLRRTGITLYKQIADSIRQQIQAGRLPHGSRVPSEDVLASRYRVARMTIRQALQELAADGIIMRRHGLGTFVSNQKIARRLTQMTGFHEDLLSRGLSPSSKVLKATTISATQTLQQRLGLAGPDPLVFLYRLGLANMEPAAVTASYFRADLCAALLHTDLEHNSLYKLLEEECLLGLGWVEQRVEAQPTSRDAARLLHVRPGSPLLKVEHLIYLKTGTLLGVSDCLYRSDRYVLSSVLYR